MKDPEHVMNSPNMTNIMYCEDANTLLSARIGSIEGKEILLLNANGGGWLHLKTAASLIAELIGVMNRDKGGLRPPEEMEVTFTPDESPYKGVNIPQIKIMRLEHLIQLRIGQAGVRREEVLTDVI